MYGRRRVAVVVLVLLLASWLKTAYNAFSRTNTHADVRRREKYIPDKIFRYFNRTLSKTRNEDLSHELEKKTKKEKLKILLLTYMRSGSTFVGSMFSVNRDVFYVFEPLHALHETMIEHEAGWLRRKSKRFVEYGNNAQQYLNDIFSCRFQSLSSENLRDKFWWYTTEGENFMKCSKKRPKNSILLDCLPMLTKACKERHVTAVKTIRLTMAMAERMIQTDQSLKVLHLVRDPRSTLNSRMALHFVYRHGLDMFSKDLCKTVYEDILIGRKLSATYPDNIKLVLYEDLTMDTMKVVREIYDFLKLPFTEEIANHVMKLGSKEENCFLCTSHSNATFQLLKWRASMRYSDVEIIDRNCGDVYNSIGYLPANSEEILRDFIRPLRIKLPKLGDNTWPRFIKKS